VFSAAGSGGGRSAPPGGISGEKGGLPNLPAGGLELATGGLLPGPQLMARSILLAAFLRA